MPKDRLRPDLAFTHCDQGLSCQAAPSISSHVFLAWNAVAKSTCLPSHWLKLSTFDGDSHRYTPNAGPPKVEVAVEVVPLDGVESVAVDVVPLDDVESVAVDVVDVSGVGDEGAVVVLDVGVVDAVVDVSEMVDAVSVVEVEVVEVDVEVVEVEVVSEVVVDVGADSVVTVVPPPLGSLTLHVAPIGQASP